MRFTGAKVSPAGSCFRFGLTLDDDYILKHTKNIYMFLYTLRKYIKMPYKIN